MRLKPSSYLLIFILLFMLVLVVESLRSPHIKLKLLPVIIGSITFILAAVELWKEIAGKAEREMTGQGKPSQEVELKGVKRQLGSTLGWMVGFFLSIYVLGLVISILLFTFCYVKLQGRGWLTSIVFALGITAFIYGVFEFGLKAVLYRGLIFGG